MSALADRDDNTSHSEQIEISPAAISAYGRLLGAVGRRLYTHAAPDGGLICEDRTSKARPTMWRILPDGEIHPDRPYSYRRSGFVAVELPHSVQRRVPARTSREETLRGPQRSRPLAELDRAATPGRRRAAASA